MTTRYAPWGSAPANQSRYIDLPVLYRCKGCDLPLSTFEEWTVILWGRAYSGVCKACADDAAAFAKASPPEATS